ncbi:MAG TPA: tetratricopeptide repeat protein [Acidobacteriota bacterium]|nr:tetratricopeptide repeat protein [Acidobacteriota bacterium]
MKIRSALLILLAVLIGFASITLAQTGAAKGKGRIRGSIKDASGAPLPDVTIRFVSERRQTNFEVKAKGDGTFAVAGMAGGAWNVDFIKEGYKDRRISIQVSELSYNAPIDVQMEKAVAAAQAAPKEKAPGLDLVEQGNALRASKDYAGAIAKYEAALTTNPALAEVHGDIARIYSEQGKYPEAIEAYKKFISAKPDNQEAKLELAAIYLQQKNIDEAKALLGGTSLDSITNPYTLYNLGVGFYNAGQTDEAIRYWEKAVSLDPKLTDAWLQLGFAYYAAGNIAKAKEALQKVIELEPGSDNAKSAQEFLASMQ